MNSKERILSYKVISIIALGVLWSSCGDSSGKQVLSPEVKYMSDTMFAKRKAALIEELDSLCLQESPKLKQKAIDSLLIIEKKRIAELSE